MLEKIKDILGLMNIPNEDLRKNVERIPWDHIFLLEAILWSRRSHDAETQCGCVLVKNNTVISTGYNGFIRDIDDELLPNVRPHKYEFFLHAEHNAILNCAKNGVSTNLSTAYVSGHPCNWCLQYMWQSGVNKIVYTDYSQPKMCDNDQFNRVKNVLLELMNPEYESIYTEGRVHRINLEFVPYKVLQEYSPIISITRTENNE